MKVAVIVPCRNERAHIDAFLENLLSQSTGDLSWGAWIADGMSTDGTRDHVRAAGDPRIHLIDNPQRSAATGLNAAIAASDGEIVIRMDVHTSYASDYVAQCLETLLRTGADNVGGPWHARGSGYTSRAIAAAFASRFCAGGAKSHDPHYEGYVDSVYLGCWRRETLTRIGPFDESLERNQDDEWNLRLTLAGGRVWQSPAIRSWYNVRPTLKALARQYFDYGFWKVAVIRKHGKPASWRHLAPGLFLLINIALVAWMPRLVLVIDAPYLILSLGFSLATAKQYGWELLPLLPLVFAVYHFAYGLGFLWGCVKAIA
jgi:glycosyltransferase involved in cell wall biosynthesis